MKNKMKNMALAVVLLVVGVVLALVLNTFALKLLWNAIAVDMGLPLLTYKTSCYAYIISKILMYTPTPKQKTQPTAITMPIYTDPKHFN